MRCRSRNFSIGFGPKLLSFKYHDTVYQIAAIPLGGFVKLAGAVSTEDIPKKFRGKEFYKSSLWARAAILFAGPLQILFLQQLFIQFLLVVE